MASKIKMPSSMEHWRGYLMQYRKFIRKNGRMSGADADALEKKFDGMCLRLSFWSGEQDIGESLVAPGCAHIYRLQRMVWEGLLHRVIRGKSASQVFYYLPRKKSHGI